MLIKNRFGRIVAVSEERGKEMILHQEGEEVKIEPEKKEEKKNPLECPYCGRILKSKSGFTSHTRACKKKVL
jgi:hypothetical protein